MGVERGGEIVAGVLFNHFEGADVHITVAGRGWSRGFLRAVGEYVFDQLDCERMTAITEQHDVADLAMRLGAEVEGCLRNHFGYGRDGIVLGILREDWKYGSQGANKRA